MMLAISFLSWLGAPDIIALFRRDDAEVIRIGTIALKLQLTMLPLIPVCSTAFVMLQGIGKNTQAMLVGIGRQGMFLVPILLVLPHFFGLTGILAAQPISDFLAFLQAMFLVRPVLAELSRMQTAEGGPQPITLRETLPL
jgi:Na+-driven multidrug efflux pump